MPDQVNQPLPLEGARNVRELGGYHTKDGRITKTHVFLRGDELHSLTKADEEYLANYGVRLVIDLRSTLEEMASPDHIIRGEMRHVHIPLLDGVQSAIAKDELTGEQSRVPKSLQEIYYMIVDTEKENIRRVMQDLIACEDCALFHCTSGKDRTGITAMLLFEAVGVPEDTIVADYAVSAKNMASKLAEDEKLAKALGKGLVPPDAFESKPEFMENLIAYLNKNYGSPVDYLKEIGLTDADFARLTKKFVADATS